MIKVLLTFCLFGILLLASSQHYSSSSAQRLRQYELGIERLRQAEALEEKAATKPSILALQSDFYLQAINYFHNAESKSSSPDSLDFHCFARQGLVFHLLDSLQLAKKYYNLAIFAGNSVATVEDSFLFMPCLYLGGIYYSGNRYDSAIYLYRQAENIQAEYNTTLQSSERLYNRLGVIQYETGNYSQARNYFEKAIALLAGSGPENDPLRVNYRMNIGSMHVKLEEYGEAMKIFSSLLPTKIFRNEVLHNIGIIYQKQGNYKEALKTFRQINYVNNSRIIDLYYNFGVVFHFLHQSDSSTFYLKLAQNENHHWNGDGKNLTLGLIYLFEGDRLMANSRFPEAVWQYQRALIQFHPSFNEIQPAKNPDSFRGVVSFLNLFNALVSKGRALSKMDSINHSIHNLDAALASYTAAFDLASYVEQVYDSDESRFFLNRIKHAAHIEPITLSLKLLALTSEKKYLHKAYYFDQRNKGAIASLNILNDEIRNLQGPLSTSLGQERLLKGEISRLSLNYANPRYKTQKEEIYRAIRELEIRLGKLHDSLRALPGYRDVDVQTVPSIKKLQNQLDGNSAIISYHLSPRELLALVITQKDFSHRVIPIDSSLFRTIEDIKRSFSSLDNAESYFRDLYLKIFKPLEDLLPASGRLVIIPDDELHYLPFETLIDNRGNYLLKRFSIQYQYTTALMEKKYHYHQKRSALAFAPFADNNPVESPFPPLPASKNEINSLKGVLLIGAEATKKKFLELAGQHRYLHLATHAQVNNDTPSRSFISFYPAGEDYLLYTSEIASLNLDSTELVILSACETGSGQLVKGEGLLSLSRAFAYAGCHDIITSLWKAEDKTTAYIMKKMHAYFRDGDSKDIALQKAKLDLLSDPGIAPNFKGPSQWAHLIFIGQYEPTRKTVIPFWAQVAAALLAFAALGFVIGKKHLAARSS